MSTEVNINNNLITWAVERAGFDIQDFAIRFPQVEDWLETRKKPTITQLEKFSKKVHLPFGYLFLNEPPKEELPIPFFRTNKDVTKISVNVYDTVLLIQQRQEWFKEYLKENEATPLNFVGKFKDNNKYLEIVDDIRKAMGTEMEWASNFKYWEDALNYLTSKIEELGIIVVFSGIVGNYTKRPIKVDECRGFVLVDEIAPFMFVNAADAKGAQLFTLVHELAHIWIGKSAGFDFRSLLPADDPNEKLCDKVAAEFLVPEDIFNKLWKDKNNINNICKYFKVSRIVVARRALDLGKITKDEFFQIYNGFLQDVKIKKKNQGDGGDFYATTKKRLSLRYIYSIEQAVKSEKLLYRDAYKLTGLKGNTYQKFIQKYFTEK
jgi:Zn-dependent peptidase ImmA (M78 family)